MKLTILGSSGTYAAQGGACTGYLIDAGGVKVWLDCGPGTLGRLGDFVKLEELAAIVISHEHPDHCLEMPVLYNALRYHCPRSPLKVFGTVGTKALIAQIVRHPLELVCDWHVVTSGDEVGIGGGRWSFDRTDHPPETLAVKVQADGRSLVFSSDTGPGWAGENFAESADVLLCEATFAHDAPVTATSEDASSPTAFDSQPGAVPARPLGTKHLLASEAADIARRLRVSRLLLTHLSPGSDPDVHLRETYDRFDGKVEVVKDYATYVI